MDVFPRSFRIFSNFMFKKYLFKTFRQSEKSKLENIDCKFLTYFLKIIILNTCRILAFKKHCGTLMLFLKKSNFPRHIVSDFSIAKCKQGFIWSVYFCLRNEYDPEARQNFYRHLRRGALQPRCFQVSLLWLFASVFVISFHHKEVPWLCTGPCCWYFLLETT